jgi:peptidoglycan/LPS O-acetylase OafA/YrhL
VTEAPEPQVQPPVVRYAGFIVLAEGIILLIVAAVLVVLALTGGTDKHTDGFNAYGTAGWFAIMGAGVTAGGRALITDRRWGRGIGVFANLLLLPVAYYIFTSHQIAYAIPVALVALTVLGMLFSPSAVQWVTNRD